MPTSSVKRLLNVPSDAQPTSKQYNGDAEVAAAQPREVAQCCVVAAPLVTTRSCHGAPELLESRGQLRVRSVAFSQTTSARTSRTRPCAGVSIASLDAAGLPRIRFHDLRHTFGTNAVQAFPLTDVKAFMDHADIQTTMIYAHHVPQQDAAHRLTALLEDRSTHR